MSDMINHNNDAWHSEIATNIRRVLKKMARLVEPCNDANSEMIDLINHADTLAQQIESESDEL